MLRFSAISIAVFAVLVMAYGGVCAQENKGAEQIVLDGGSRGLVHFPHHRHQNALGDCRVCHHLFAQEKGSIAKGKANGQLVIKQVMTKLCIQCHRDKKQADKPAGPTTCSKCHVKE